MQLNLIDLRLILAIADSGSLSRAAAEFPLALSAASNRLRQFEERHAVILFKRDSAGMIATPAGKIVLEQARRILAETEQLQHTLQDLSGQRRIKLRLAATTVANNTYLPAALGPFLADYPEIDLQLEEKSSRQILAAVQDKEADIGVLDGNLVPETLYSVPFRHFRLVLLVSAKHPLASRQHCLLRDALSYYFIGLPKERAIQGFIEGIAMQHGRPLKIRVRAPSFYAQAQLVAQEAGIAMLPEITAQRHARELDARLIYLDDPWASRELRLCVFSLGNLSPQASQLLHYLSQSASKERDPA
ncbi:LysR substrate-binding domain-containing protein [Undibacterium curvum]|uniref:LysR substrate-binding domain-containing protein n=1 Tax=Undibacterium curvum TaxID=2762294 RepID=UPI003D0C4107